MPNDNLTLDEIKKMAADIGLTRLTEEHLQQLMVATRQARSRRDALPPAGAIGVSALAGGAALVGLWILKDL